MNVHSDSESLSSDANTRAARPGLSHINLPPVVAGAQTQEQQYGERLRRCNYIVGELFIALRRHSRNRQQCRLFRAEIVSTTFWMNFFVEQLEQIIAQSAEEKPDLIKLKARIVCHDCRQKSRSATHHYGQSNVAEAAPDFSVWQAEVRSLLAFIHRVAGDLFEETCAFSDLKKFPPWLTKLRNTFLRQKRYLARIGAEDTKFLAESLSGRCAECGESISIDEAPETPPAGLGSPN